MRVGVIALSGAIVLSGTWSFAQNTGHRPEKKVGAETFELDHYDVSRPLRDVRPIPPEWWALEDHPVKRWPHQHAARKLGSQPDPALQASQSLSPVPLVGTTAGLNFDGIGVPNYTVSGAPPDTNGAVGATQYVQWVNTAFAVFNKSTGAMVYGPANGNTIWQGFGGRCETDNSGDPIVMYDKAANRWVMTQFAVSASPYYQCIAVSTTADATGTWRRFAYQFGTDMNDYPKGGVWPDGYYITFNMFANAATWKGAKVCAFDRNQMLTASGTPGAMQCFQLSTTYGGLLPADLDGATPPPAGAPNYVLAFDDVGLNGVNLWKFHVDWTTPASSTFTGPTKIAGAAFIEACNGATCITQPGTTQQLDSLADRMMYRLAYRNFGDHESLVTNHSVDVSGHSGLRWYEVRSPGGTPTMFQQGTFSPDTNHRWMGSIAQDQSGNMLAGYSVSGTVKPSVRYTGRLASDALGTMQAETEMFAGTGVQTATLSRWGDYSAMTVDPSDDCTFWYTTEYVKANGTFNWSTRVGSFKFASCGGTATPDFSVGASPSSLTIAQGGSGTSTVTVTSIAGFSSAVSLSASGLPAGVTASFAPSSVTPPANGSASSTLTLTASAVATAGAANVTVTGTSGATSHTAAISLTVTSASQAAYDATLKAPKCGAVGNLCNSGTLLNGRDGKGPEPNQPNTINTSCADGTSGTYHVDESNDAIKVTSVDGTAFAPGKSVRVDATVWAYSTFSSDHLDLYYAANASSPTWTLIGTFTPAGAGARTISATYTLPPGSLQAVRARFRYNGSAAACGTGAYDDHDDLVFAVGAGAPDTTPPTTSITAPVSGATVTGTTTVSASASDNVGVTRVELYVDNVLTLTDTTSPYSFSWNTTTYANGSHSLQTKAYDAAGNVGSSATINVTVSNVAIVSAVYDATLKAPKCATAGAGCDSGTLLNGRDGKGPEPNQPNTINTSCADGTSGTYHSDESNDKIRVVTTDGSTLAAGKTVRVEATVWAWSTPSSDKLDLYYAANANSPTWTLIGTLTPTAAGASTLSATYTLPAGTLQAVRARFRYQGSAAACGTGAYDDHDDLVFAVQ